MKVGQLCRRKGADAKQTCNLENPRFWFGPSIFAI
jgi:hypothetical protein